MCTGLTVEQPAGKLCTAYNLSDFESSLLSCQAEPAEASAPFVRAESGRILAGLAIVLLLLNLVLIYWLSH